MPHRRGLRGALRYTALITIPASLASLRPTATYRPKNRFAVIAVGVLSALGAAVALLWNQIILSCTFGAIGAINIASFHALPTPPNGNDCPRH